MFRITLCYSNANPNPIGRCNVMSMVICLFYNTARCSVIAAEDITVPAALCDVSLSSEDFLDSASFEVSTSRISKPFSKVTSLYSFRSERLLSISIFQDSEVVAQS
jgi:hypothetical protein